MADSDGFDDSKEVDDQREALETTIRLLRKADRWRWHKRNTVAIAQLRMAGMRLALREQGSD